jgi:glutamate-1-semialdehyde 2,1-aminomutase
MRTFTSTGGDASDDEAAGCSTLLVRARRVAPGGIQSCRRETDPVICPRRAYGAYIEDLEGRRLIDYHGAYGCIVLGHCFPAVIDRVTAAIQEGDAFGVGTTEGEVALAEKLVEHVPSVEQVLLCNSGGEATYNAIRLARGTTGREKVVKFQGCYHGSHDYVLSNALTVPGATVFNPDASAGVLRAAAESVLVCRYNDLDSVDAAFAAHPGQVAGVIVEPILHNAATIAPAEGFLEGLRSFCDEHGAVLIFDEVISGFRHGLGGYQTHAGVTPDLTTFAKAMGNGFPIGAIGGRADLMEQFNTFATGGVFYSGTYNGGVAAVEAARAVIDVLESESVLEHTFALGERMRAGLRRIVEDAGIEASVVGFGSIYGLIFAAGPLTSYDDVLRNDADLFLRFKHGLIERGVLEMPAINAMRSHISFSHTEDDVDRTLEASAASLLDALDNDAVGSHRSSYQQTDAARRGADSPREGR